MKNLYQLGEEQKEILAELELCEGEVTDSIQVKMNLLAENIEEKAVAYGFVIKQFEGEQSLIKAEIDRLKGLLDISKKRSEYLKERISAALIEFGIEKVESPTLKLSFRKSESVEVVDERLLDAKYFNYAPTIDKVSIKADLKIGGVLGAQMVQKLNLQIR